MLNARTLSHELSSLFQIDVVQAFKAAVSGGPKGSSGNHRAILAASDTAGKRAFVQPVWLNAPKRIVTAGAQSKN